MMFSSTAQVLEGGNSTARRGDVGGNSHQLAAAFVTSSKPNTGPDSVIVCCNPEPPRRETAPFENQKPHLRATAVFT